MENKVEARLDEKVHLLISKETEHLVKHEEILLLIICMHNFSICPQNVIVKKSKVMRHSGAGGLLNSSRAAKKHSHRKMNI